MRLLWIASIINIILVIFVLSGTLYFFYSSGKLDKSIATFHNSSTPLLSNLPTSNTIPIKINQSLAVDKKSGFSYGVGTVVEKKQDVLITEFLDGERRQLILEPLNKNALFIADGKDYYDQERIDRYNQIKSGEKVFVVFSPGLIITFLKIMN